MLRYVTKKQYWAILDSGITKDIKPTFKWHLKDVQDAIAFSHLRGLDGKTIAEIGAGHSRILPTLARRNLCYAIDEYKGADGGPATLPDISGVQFVRARLGVDSGALKKDQFDVVFSVSVIEHITNKDLPSLFSECWRILKPEGLMIHLIDAYVKSAPSSDDPLPGRIQVYRKPLDEGMFSAIGPVELGGAGSLSFQSTLVTNPDDMMREWNKAFPLLRELRENAQSCAIELAYRKKLPAP